METVLNTIIDNARAAASAGIPKLNPYPEGTLRHLAYEIGYDRAGLGVIATCADGQVYAVYEVEPGEYQSVVPRDLAEQGRGKCHTSLADAASYLRELVIEQGCSCASLAA